MLWRTRRLLGALAIGAGALLPIGPAPGTACAGEGDRAALVIDTGESELRYCVELDDDTVTGLELIELAGEQHGFEYHLGFGGQAVCMLAGVGPTGDDCFETYPDFWGYWRGTGDGGWTWSGSGAGSTAVEDGDVEGWSWGSGDGPDTHPEPPDTEFADVCTVQSPSPDTSEADPSENEPSGGAEETPPAENDAGQASAAAAGPQPREGARSRASSAAGARDRRWHEGLLGAELVAPIAVASPTPTLTPTDAPTDIAAAPSSDESASPAGVAALIATGALIAAGAFITYKRRV